MVPYWLVACFLCVCLYCPQDGVGTILYDANVLHDSVSRSLAVGSSDVHGSRVSGASLTRTCLHARSTSAESRYDNWTAGALYDYNYKGWATRHAIPRPL